MQLVKLVKQGIVATAAGLILGEAIFLVGVLDVVRGRVMADATGVQSFKWATPVAAVVFWMSTPAGEFAHSTYGQAPLPLFGCLIGYWALLGVVAMHAALLLRWLARKHF